LPKPRKKVERPRWKLAAALAFVDQVLQADKKAPRKQRHTAHRIWERIQREIPLAFVDQVLQADKKAPRKQRHTAKLIAVAPELDRRTENLALAAPSSKSREELNRT